jgi:hypothetical protein
VRPGDPVSLQWSSEAGRHYVVVEKRTGGGPVREALAGGSPVDITLRKLGLYQWRVARVDERGLEGIPSEAGYVCVVER